MHKSKKKKINSMLALVDCNNFFVSCERIFNPLITHKPVIVLSNNDGCVIARSNEVKEIGIPMGIPFFKIQHIVNNHKIFTFSSNFALYGDISKRVMRHLRDLSPAVEVYSVDEAFIECPQKFKKLEIQEMESFAIYIRESIKQYIGVPVSVGIAATKTLAKAAVEVAKKSKNGVCILKDEQRIDSTLKNLDIRDVWGVGKQLEKNLKLSGIFNALDFKKSDPRLIREKYSVVVERIVRELIGIMCSPINELAGAQKSIQVSRSLGQEINSVISIKQVLSSHISKLAEKLRKQGLYCKGVGIWIASNRFKGNYYSKGVEKYLENPTNFTDVLLKEMLPLVDEIYKKGISYKRLGVTGFYLVNNVNTQKSIFEPKENNHINHKNTNLYTALDSINKRFGHKSIYYGACGINPSWGANCLKKSPSYTTCWKQIKEVN